MSCKHKTLQSAALSDSSACGSVSRAKADSEGKGAPRNDRTVNHQSYSPVVKQFAGLHGLRSILICSELSKEACPHTLLERCALYVRKKFRALRAPHSRTNPTSYACAPPFFNLWIRPCMHCCPETKSKMRPKKKNPPIRNLVSTLGSHVRRRTDDIAGNFLVLPLSETVVIRAG